MKTKNRQAFLALASITFFVLTVSAFGDVRDNILRRGIDLEKAASYLAQSSFDHFKGWDDEITDKEQAVLFESEAFASSVRLFLRLMEERSGYFGSDNLHTNLYSAFMYLNRSFQDLEREMRRANIQPYSLNDCRKIVSQIDREFSAWPSAENLAYLEQKYVKSRDDTVYLIEKKGTGRYFRHAFKNLESLYRYNYDLKRGDNPWDHLVEVEEDTLRKMSKGSLISLSFEGYLLIEQSQRPNRPVYLIEGGKKRGITSPQVLQRYGGWGKVKEVPAEVIRSYADGEPIR